MLPGVLQSSDGGAMVGDDVGFGVGDKVGGFVIGDKVGGFVVGELVNLVGDFVGEIVDFGTGDFVGLLVFLRAPFGADCVGGKVVLGL